MTLIKISHKYYFSMLEKDYDILALNKVPME